MMESSPFETVTTPHLHVACDGDAGPSGHPRVFLHIESEAGSVICPYCSRHFIHQATADEAYRQSERAVAAPVTGAPANTLDPRTTH